MARTTLPLSSLTLKGFDSKPCVSAANRSSLTVSPNKHMQRAGRHKVLGRGRVRVFPGSAPRARVLSCRRAGADVNR
jgi:hypothetical protein